MGSRSKYITYGGRKALEYLAEAYRADVAQKLAALDLEQLQAWEDRQAQFLKSWSDELDKIGDRGVEYELMLDMQLIARSVAAQRRRGWM